MMLSLSFWPGEEKKVMGYNEISEPNPPKDERRDSGLGFDPLFDPPVSEIILTHTESPKSSTKPVDTAPPGPRAHRKRSSWFNFTVERVTRFFSDEDDESFYTWVQEQNISRYGAVATTPGPVERVLDGVVDYFGIGEITAEPESMDNVSIENECEVLFDVQELGEVIEAEKKAAASSAKRQSRRMSNARFPPVTIMADEYM